MGLPMDILRKIAAQLAVTDLNSLMQTSRAGYTAISEDNLIWSSQLMARVPPRGIVPVSVTSASSSPKEQLRLLFDRHLCAGCGKLLPFGPSDTPLWQLLGLAACRAPECFQRATISAEQAQALYVLDEADLVSLRGALPPGIKAPLYSRRDVKRASYMKYGGPKGLEARKRSLFKQQQLMRLSQFKPMTTRPTDLLLDEDIDFL